MMTDPIADMLTQIRNGVMAQKEKIELPLSKIKLKIADILEKNGYIKGYRKIARDKNDVQGKIEITLKYTPAGESVIHVIKRVSLPSRRRYIQAKEIQPTCGGLGISVISTSMGIMTGDEAKRRNVGGEIICEVW